MEESILKKLVVEKLSTVYDPEIPVNIWDLGLVYEVDFPKRDTIVVIMTLTAPGCPVAGDIIQEVHDAVASIEGINSVSVDLVFDPAWDPSKMTEEAKLELGFDLTL